MAMIMSLSEFKFPPHVVVKVPEKSYFKKYPYKIEFIASKEEQEYKTRQARNNYSSWRYNRPNFVNVKVEVTNKLQTLIKEAEEKRDIEFDYRIRQEGTVVSIFFNDPEIISLVFDDKLKGKVTTVYKPLNENHLTKMELEKRVRVRKSLFLNKFKFKVYLKPYAMRKFNVSELESWLEETFPEEHRMDVNPGLRKSFSSKDSKNNKSSWYYNTTLAIYLNDETDLMVSKLRLNDYISHVEEAVLISEL